MSFTYLMSPYTHVNPSVMNRRFIEAECATYILLSRGQHIYSPIVHNHEMAKKYNLPKDYTFWESYNYAMLAKASKGLILTLDDWELSKGIQGERNIANLLSIPVDLITSAELNLQEELNTRQSKLDIEPI